MTPNSAENNTFGLILNGCQSNHLAYFVAITLARCCMSGQLWSSRSPDAKSLIGYQVPTV